MEQQTQFEPDPCPTPRGVILRTAGLVLFLVEHCPSQGWFFKYMKLLYLFYVQGPFFRMSQRALRGGRVGYLYSPLFSALLDLGFSEDLSGGPEQGSPAERLVFSAVFSTCPLNIPLEHHLPALRQW